MWRLTADGAMPSTAAAARIEWPWATFSKLRAAVVKIGMAVTPDRPSPP
jgi:hypothetical protein